VKAALCTNDCGWVAQGEVRERRTRFEEEEDYCAKCSVFVPFYYFI